MGVGQRDTASGQSQKTFGERIRGSVRLPGALPGAVCGPLGCLACLEEQGVLKDSQKRVLLPWDQQFGLGGGGGEEDRELPGKSFLNLKKEMPPRQAPFPACCHSGEVVRPEEAAEVSDQEGR